MVKAGASDHSLICLAIGCCVNLFSRRSFIALIPSVELIQAGSLGERLPAHPQPDCRAKSRPCIPLATWRLEMLMGKKRQGYAERFHSSSRGAFWLCTRIPELLSALYNQPA